MREGTVFTGVCLFTFRAGVPHPADGGRGGNPIPGPGRGRYPIPGPDGGYPVSGGGCPIPGLDREVYPTQVHIGGGCSIPGLDGGYPHPELNWVPPVQDLPIPHPLFLPPAYEV